MEPIIKWPGGKSKEYEVIKNLIPIFSRYVEPFFGGGAVFFKLQAERATINDTCEELIEFYRFVKGERNKTEFKKCLYEYADNWEKIPKFLKLFEEDLIKLYGEYKVDKKTDREVREIITYELKTKEEQFNGLFLKEFALDPDNLLGEIIKNLFSKIKRTKEIEKKRGTIPKKDLNKNIETAFRSGFYMHFRKIMNKNGSKYKTSLAKKIANYYFIREFCYGSMFRFNSKGEFNIPYGGIGYNRKNFRGKVDYIFSKEVEELFKNTKILNRDFEETLEEEKLDKNDFVFLDPPYDTDFSNYEKKEFGRSDQERLAKCLYKIKAKFIFIIKNTSFILNLYKNKNGININKFDKTYLYNVKGRNNRDAEHLLITNF